MPKDYSLWSMMLLVPFGCSLLTSCASTPPLADRSLDKPDRRVTQIMPSETSAPSGQTMKEPISPTATSVPTDPATTAMLATATPTAASTVMPRETPQHHPATQQMQQPAVAPAAEPTVGAPAQLAPAAAAAVQKARDDLVQRLGDANAPIELLSVARRFKPNGSSDTPGRLIGWTIRFAVGDQVYMYQVDTNGVLRHA